METSRRRSKLDASRMPFGDSLIAHGLGAPHPRKRSDILRLRGRTQLSMESNKSNTPDHRLAVPYIL